MKIVHVKESSFDIYIGRAMPGFEQSKWANFHKITPTCSREEAVAKYKQDVLNSPDLLDSLEELRDLTVGCWCKDKTHPDRLCHGDALRELLEERPFNIGKKLAVVGSRDYEDYEYLKQVLDKHQPKAIISGGCPTGADFLADKYAKERGLSILIHYPDWKLGKSAGFKRNTKIVNSCEELVAFWIHRSPGTKDSIDKCRFQNKRVTIYCS